MQDFYSVIANVGFPIAVTAFLLVRVERKLDELNTTLIKLTEAISIHEN